MSLAVTERAPSSDYVKYLPLVPQLERQGFLRIPLEPALKQASDRVFPLANEFFARTPAEKQHFAAPAWVEGYRELGPEYSQVPERPDLTESFSAWNRNRARPELENWATGCPLHMAMRETADLLNELVRGLFAAMVAHFAPGAPELRFYNATYLQLNYYEPARHARDLLQDAHEDGHLVTIVRTNAPGLEIKVDGEFVPANVGENELLVMPSSLLSLMTGNRVKPLYHQVRNNRQKTPRASQLFFVNPEIDRPIAPWVSNETNAGIDIVEAANAAPKQFGMPTLVDSLEGHAETRRHDPAFAGAAQ